MERLFSPEILFELIRDKVAKVVIAKVQIKMVNSYLLFGSGAAPKGN